MQYRYPKIAVVKLAILLMVFASCTKEEPSAFDKFYESMHGRWSVVNQVQHLSVDSTFDTIPGASDEFMDFRVSDTLYSNTLIYGKDTSAYQLLNVYNFLVKTDTLKNSSLTPGFLSIYYKRITSDTTYTELWVNLLKDE